MEKNKEKEVDVLLEEADKCFVIMPISDQGEYPKGHFSKVYEQIFKPAILEAGYEPYRVDEDKISMSEMKEIRNLTDKTSYEKSYETSIYPEGRFITNEKRNNPVYSGIIWPKQDTYKYLVKLKQGVTSKEIEQALNKIRNNGLKVKYMRNGNELVVEGETIYSVNEKMMLQEILEKLGVVVPFV